MAAPGLVWAAVVLLEVRVRELALCPASVSVPSRICCFPRLSGGGVRAEPGWNHCICTQPLKPVDGMFDGDGAPKPCSVGNRQEGSTLWGVRDRTQPGSGKTVLSPLAVAPAHVCVLESWRQICGTLSSCFPWLELRLLLRRFHSSAPHSGTQLSVFIAGEAAAEVRSLTGWQREHGAMWRLLALRSSDWCLSLARAGQLCCPPARCRYQLVLSFCSTWPVRGKSLNPSIIWW